MNKKTRTHRFSKLPDDGDPWEPNNLLKVRSKRDTSWAPVDKFHGKTTRDGRENKRLQL